MIEHLLHWMVGRKAVLSDALAGHPPEPLSEQLPYEDLVGLDGRAFVVLADGALGAVWRLPLLDSELMGRGEMDRVATGVAHALVRASDEVEGATVVWQLLLDSGPAWHLDRPPGAQADTAAGRALARHLSHLERWAEGGPLGLGTFRSVTRQLHLTVRLEPVRRGLSLRGPWTLAHATQHANATLEEDLQRLSLLCDRIEGALRSVAVPATPCDADALVRVLQRGWMDPARVRDADPAVGRPYEPALRLGDQLVKDDIALFAEAVQIGSSWTEVLTWLAQPPQVPGGVLQALLFVTAPFRAVLTLRPQVPTHDLALRGVQLRLPSTSARTQVQQEEHRWLNQQRARGERLVGLTLGVTVVTEGGSRSELERHGGGQQVRRVLARAGLDVSLERASTAALFSLLQPLATSSAAVHFIGRERRVLSPSVLSAYLPLWGGYRGSQAPSDPARGQVWPVHNRTGQPVWLSPYTNPINPHIAFLGASGGGKSTALARLLLAMAAWDPKTLISIVDERTSYRVLGEVLGEHQGFSLVQPPLAHIAIWRGELTETRLGVLVSLLRLAIGLVEPAAAGLLTADHDTVLSDAIRKAYEGRDLSRATAFVAEGDELLAPAEANAPRRQVRLSDVVQRFASAAAERGLDPALAVDLTRRLAAFWGDGRYAAVLDAIVNEPPDEVPPAIAVFDLAECAEDPVLKALYTAMAVSEIVRALEANKGRRGVLVIEEIGVLLASQAMTDFVGRIWRTGRGIGLTLIAVANQAVDYLTQPAGREVWRLSAHHVFLPLTFADVEAACEGHDGVRLLDRDSGVAAAVRTLTKDEGQCTEAVWHVQDEAVGASGSVTLLRHPEDVWLTAKAPGLVADFLAVAERMGAGAALSWLAERFPSGPRDERGQLRRLRDEELP